MSAAAAPARRRKPVWQQVEEQDARRVSSRVRRAAARSGGARRYAVVYDIDGPRVRLGMAWFVVAVGALVLGPLATALVYGCAAAIGAAQAARCWRRGGYRASELFAGGSAAAIALGAVLGAGGMGLGILAATAAAYAGAAGERRSTSSTVANAGMTLQCALPLGAVAGSMVLLLRLDVGSAFALLLLVSAYEIGDYLIGSGASNSFEGPLAGIAAMAVVTFIVSGFPITSLEVLEAMALCVLTMLAAPAGQLLGSAILPAAAAPASGLRRLDSLLIAAPAWAWAVGVLG